MRVTTLASGSKGNCVYIEGDDGAVLVDAGLSAREILARLAVSGGKPDLIRALLVTHEHGDHIQGVSSLARKLRVPILGTQGTLSEVLRTASSRATPDVIPCQYNEEIPLSDFLIRPFATSHDALEPCGFCIEEGDLRVGCCTDTGVVSSRLVDCFRRCDMVILESNHCPEMLENGPYPAMLKRRIRSKKGHLSNTSAGECLQELARDVPVIQLAHLSEINNTPAKALASAREAFGLFVDMVDLSVGLQHGVSPTKYL
ncbi:MAG: MBL fold metallo-hydrolase [Methanomicrobiales archaeon]|nr:MBL fold metallo-hydrolase [Methanomicrobiales archaeon]